MTTPAEVLRRAKEIFYTWAHPSPAWVRGDAILHAARELGADPSPALRILMDSGPDFDRAIALAEEAAGE